MGLGGIDVDPGRSTDIGDTHLSSGGERADALGQRAPLGAFHGTERIDQRRRDAKHTGVQRVVSPKILGDSHHAIPFDPVHHPASFAQYT